MKKTYAVILEKRVLSKDLSKLHAETRNKILARINKLKNNPFPLNCKKLEGYRPVTYRLRQGNYRILYRVNDDVIEVRVIKVAHRSIVYR